MIVPFLDGFMMFSRAPITWLIILLNAFLFSQNYSLSNDCQEQFEAWYQDTDFLYTQGQIYKQFSNKPEAKKIKDMETLGRLAFRDEAFMSRAPQSTWSGDSVAIKSWKRDISEFMVVRAYYPPLLLGMSDSRKDFISSLSYQFYHEGFFHLLGNMMLVLIVGGYLERRYSGSLVFATYVVGGSLAALLFAQTSGMSGAPLVGASGSLCALLGLLFSLEFKNKTRLFYMFLPAPGYMGFVSVSTIYWVILFCMIEDVSGWMAQPEAFSSGVAHLVHLLGFIVGVTIGFLIKPLALQIKRSRQSTLSSRVA